MLGFSLGTEDFWETDSGYLWKEEPTEQMMNEVQGGG